MPIIWIKILKWVGISFAIGIFAWGLYAGLIRPTTKPNPSENQNAENIINYNYSFEPHQTFGCARYIAPENKKEK